MMSERKRKHSIRGEWIVIVLAAVGLMTVAWSWMTYHETNPTSVDAVIEPLNGGWTARARFTDKQIAMLTPGTAAVITSPQLPDQKLSGRIARAVEDGWYEIELTTPPSDGTPRVEMQGFVTVDAATAPVSP
jgi:multidrug resistance efflux pump